MPGPTRPSITERVLARTLSRAIERGTRDYPDLGRPAGGPPQVGLIGPDPLRILIIGSGVAVGLGVRTHREAITGTLADAVHARTGRGVIVQNRAGEQQSVGETVEALGEVGAATFGGVVWCPSLHDVVMRPDRGRYRAALVRGFALLRRTAQPDAPIVFCSVPPSRGTGPMEDIARVLVRRYRSGVDRVAAGDRAVHVVDSPAFTSPLDPLAFSADYHRQWADSILPAVLPRAALPG